MEEASSSHLKRICEWLFSISFIIRYVNLQNKKESLYFSNPCIKKILGEKVYLFNEQVVNKEPQTESKFAWHQDSCYVGYEHKTYLSIWIALCDVSENNGALRILPKNIENNVKIEIDI